MNIRSKLKIQKVLIPDLESLLLFIFFAVCFAHQLNNTVDSAIRFLILIVILLYFLATGFLKYDRKKGIKISLGPYEQWLLFFFFFSCLSILWGLEASRSIHYIQNWIRVILPILVIAPTLTTKEKTEKTIFIMFLALVYTAILLLLKTPPSEFGTERIGYKIGLHSNEIGRLTSFGALFCLYYIYKEKARMVMILLLAAFTVLCMLTGSKNAIFLLIFQLGLFYYLKSGSFKKILVVILIVAGTAFLLWFVMNNEVLYGLVGYRLEKMYSAFTGGDISDGSTSERLYFIKTAWALFLEHPILGVGYNNFASYLGIIGYENPVYSHCGIVELLSTLGIVGFSIYYSLFIFLMKRLRSVSFKEDLLANLLFVTVVRILVFDVSGISCYLFYNYLIFMLIYAYTSFLPRQNKKVVFKF